MNFTMQLEILRVQLQLQKEVEVQGDQASEIILAKMFRKFVRLKILVQFYAAFKYSL